MADEPIAYLFSYGTLRQREVQVSVFGRELEMAPDALPGFELGMVRILDPKVIATSGSDEHPILRRSGDPEARIDGAALAVSPADLVSADAYEVDDYRRVAVELASGRRAYVYVARDEA